MMKISVIFIVSLVFLLLLDHVTPECPNACNGKGSCQSDDVCMCYKGWMGNDCGQRLCQFGRAHVDVPKGDLDGTGTITGPNKRVTINSQRYKYGTWEQYPNMVDSDNAILKNTAHEYVECSNKGVCDRDSAQCLCLPGYEGSACQYASCPNQCSGHGLCETSRELAYRDAGNIYEMWDADITLGCHCDAGFYGADCSLKRCKVGYDPIYKDPEWTPRYSNWSIVIFHRGNESYTSIRGNYSLVFYDETGQRWKTRPIDYGASCKSLLFALHSLPNSAIPRDSVRCMMWSDYGRITQADEPILMGSCSVFPGCFGNIRIAPGTYKGIKYTLSFPSNPGILRPPALDWHLDGARPTLATNEYKSTLGAFIYANGFQGEYSEYFTEKCTGVDVTLLTISESPSTSTYTVLSGLSSIEKRRLAACLGDSDGEATYDAAGVLEGTSYTWDYGSTRYPHIVKLVDRTPSPRSDLCPEPEGSMAEANSSSYSFSSNSGRSSSSGRSCRISAPPGFYAVMYYKVASDQFVLLNRPGEDHSPTTTFAVFTTTSILSMTTNYAKVITNPLSPYSSTVYTTNTSTFWAGYRGNVDCENISPPAFGAWSCVEKGDKVIFLDPSLPVNNPKYVNIYTIRRAYTASSQHTPPSTHWSQYVRLVLDSAITSHWHHSDPTINTRMYKFSPPSPYESYSAAYVYVSECSNRGLCSTSGVDQGQCKCFDSFTGDACSVENNWKVV